jgi:hypothetical protein
MSVSSKIKAFMLIKDKSTADIAVLLGIKEQSFRNKLTKENFTVPELIAIAEALGAKLTLDIDNGLQRVTFDRSDLPPKE